MFNPWVRKIPWRRKWQPTLVFLPGTFHGQRSLVSYSPWDHKESDKTWGLSNSNRDYVDGARRGCETTPTACSKVRSETSGK